MALTEVMLTTWTSYVKTQGDPNQASIATKTWPNINLAQLSSNNTNFPTRWFDITGKDDVSMDYRTPYCNFWDSIGYDY